MTEPAADDSMLRDLAVLAGQVFAVSAAVRVLVMALPQDSPLRTTLQSARDHQERELRGQGRPAELLFACERAWQSMLGD